jgi:rfaE bifunctional protein kinase chain/domain
VAVAAVFVDKDGTLVEDVPYNVDPDLIRLAPGAVEALPLLHASGYRLIVISNQSGVARGYFNEDALGAVETRLRDLLAGMGVPLTGFYYCPHHPGGSVSGYARACDCRKPEPGLILQAARDHDVDLDRSWFIGDILHDVEAGRRAGCRTILLDNGHETEWQTGPYRTPHHVAPDLAAAARIVASEWRARSPSLLAARHSPLATDLATFVDAFGGLEVLVVGEAMLDSYLEGTAARLCREGPVPIVDVAGRRDVPGGAANTAANVHDLGGRVTLLSVVGDDAEGERLEGALRARGVSTDQVPRQRGRRTLAKQRVVADGQLVVRFDQGDTDAIDAETERDLLDRLERLLLRCDAVVVSDYGYGILTPSVIRAIAAHQERSPKVVVIDAKDLPSYRGVRPTIVKPNYAEAVQLLDARPRRGADERVRQLIACGDRLLDLTGARMAAVTLDVDGALLFERGRPPYRTYAEPTHHSRAAGAGDTFVGALALALAAGADPPIAAEIASTAATVVVAKEGTATCSGDELCGVLHVPRPAGQASANGIAARRP